jgi:hypothetical protein
MAETSVVLPSYVTVLAEALREQLPGADVRFEHIRTDRYRFVVVWPQFDRMDHPERQRLVWDIVEQTLSKPDLLKVGMILTLGAEDLPQA